jgi:hypothetical protein
VAALTLGTGAGIAPARAQNVRHVPLDSGWSFAGEGSRIDTLRGERAILLRTGEAVRRDVAFENGEIEFDVAMTSYRSFVYVKFRVQSDDEYEAIYFRPHKTNLPDAVQYDPVWNGESNWQLYHGEGGTVAVPLPHEGWMHVRIAVEGKRAALFLDRAAEPQMVMALARDPAPGYLAFQSFTPPVPGPPAGAPPEASTGAFTNIVVRSGTSSFRFAGTAAAAPVVPGLVNRWQVSPPFEVPRGLVSQLPAALMSGKRAWPTYAVEPTGVLVIGRHVRRPAAQAAVVSRLILRSPTASLRRLRLGYSDYVTVFVNGRPIFGGDAHYSFDRPRQDGVIGLDQATLWLPLRAGENELLFLVADGFGGWGLMAQLEPPAGGAAGR